MDRAKAWERRLRSSASVTGVVISRNTDSLGDVDACIMLEDVEEKGYRKALKIIRAGMHLFWVGPLPTDAPRIEELYHASEEANIILQFSHWATFSPATQWMINELRKPKVIHIMKELPRAAYLNLNRPFEYTWIEDLGLCLKWMNSNVHRIDANLIRLTPYEPIAIQIYLRFENGASSVIFVNTMSASSRHERFAADNNITIQCNVLSQELRIAYHGGNEDYSFERKEMESTETADIALNNFLKSIHLHRPAIYSGYDALVLANTIHAVHERLLV